MSDTTIFHNPRCGKSRQTLALLQAEGIQPNVVEYLKSPPDTQTLDKLLTMLGMQPQELIRTKEKEYADLGLAERNLSREEWLQVMVDHPILIERPIVVKDGKARIGRPPELVREIL